MKVVQVLNSATLCLVLATIVPAYAQRDQQDEKHGKPENEKQQGRGRQQQEQRAQQEMILPRPELRLSRRPLENMLRRGPVFRAECRDALIKRVKPSEWKHDEQRQRQKKKAGGLEDALIDRGPEKS